MKGFLTSITLINRLPWDTVSSLIVEVQIISYLVWCKIQARAQRLDEMICIPSDSWIYNLLERPKKG